MKAHRSACMFAVLLTAVGCEEPRSVNGVVTDAWNKPVAGATVRMDGVLEPATTDGGGHFSFLLREGAIQLTAGKDGYIPSAASLAMPEGDEVPEARLMLYKDPPEPGFFAIGRSDYEHLPGAKVRTVGTEVRAFTGIREDGDVVLAAKKDGQFIYTSTLEPSELKQLNLQLHKLEYVEKAEVPGVTEGDSTINLFVAKEKVEYELKGLQSRDDYLIVTKAPLTRGTYAFHTNGILDSTEYGALDKLPKEMQVAFPFSVK